MSSATPTSPPLGQRLRSGWLWLALVLAVLVVLAFAGRPAADVPLDPDNSAPGGTMALAQVLRRQGVQVKVVRSLDELRDIARGEATKSSTLVMFDTKGVDDGEHVLPRDVRQPFGRVVLGSLSAAALEPMGYQVIDEYSPDTAMKSCDDPELGQARTIWGSMLRYHSDEGWQQCFGGVDGYALLSRTDAGQRVELVADAAIFSNGVIDEHDNAALGLRLLGRDRQLVWYVPDSVPARSMWDQGTMRALPPWTSGALSLAMFAGLVAVFWRGRRLGRLVAEPLPVEIASLETTLNRGRLFRAANEPAHAGAILQRATAARLAQLLGHHRGWTIDQLVTSVATATGSDPSLVHALLTRPAPSNDELVRLARALAELEKMCQMRMRG